MSMFQIAGEHTIGYAGSRIIFLKRKNNQDMKNVHVQIPEWAVAQMLTEMLNSITHPQ